jgi:hypothetical protein
VSRWDFKHELPPRFDHSLAIADWTDAQPLVHSVAARTPDEGGHVKGQTAVEACFVRLQYRLDAYPPGLPATLALIPKEVPPDVIQQLPDRRAKRQKIIDNRYRSFQRFSSQRLPLTAELDVVQAAPVRVAKDFVSLMSLTKSFRIGALANVGMKLEGDAPVGTLDLTRRRSLWNSQRFVKVSPGHAR